MKQFWIGGVKAHAAAIAAVLVLDMFSAPVVAGAPDTTTSRIDVRSSAEVAEVRITFEKVAVIIGAYDRVRYKIAVEALGEHRQRVDVRTSALLHTRRV